VVAAVTVIAFATMTLNAAAWVWGVSRLVAAAADAAILPDALTRTGDRGVPWRAVLLLGCLSA
jgi:amino acid transporter